MLKKFCFAVLYLTFFYINIGIAQTSIEELKQAYAKNSGGSKENCLLKIITSEAKNYPDNQRIQQIILIRHGEPLLPKDGLFTSYMAQEYSRLYDEVEVMDFEQRPVCLENLDLDTIYASNLVRAKNTAQKIIENRNIHLQSEKLFREFEREILPVPFIRLPLNFWLVFSRLMWYARLNTSNIEGYDMAKKRIAYAAKFLEYKSNKNDLTLLVAHGMFNKSLAAELKKRGWTLVYSNGLGYLNVRVLAKQTE
ncbi:histidine phosphatase family protein [Hyphobacterium sp. CCMP332]|nr:histidine phosphatase family protein [Hyphobacterium sp. CCMP332]